MKPELTQVNLFEQKFILLNFTDGVSAKLPVEKLEMAMKVDWSTVRTDGDNLLVDDLGKNPISVGANVLRYLVDEKYKRRTDKELESIQLTDEELEEICSFSKVHRCLEICTKMDSIQPQSQEWFDLSQKYDQIYESMDQKEKMLFTVKLNNWQQTAEYLEKRWFKGHKPVS